MELTAFKNGNTIGRATFEPVWIWDKCVKPVVKTNNCEAPHKQYIVPGCIKIMTDNWVEEEFGPGDTVVIPSGHNAWIIGDESAIAIDFTDMSEYAKKHKNNTLSLYII